MTYTQYGGHHPETAALTNVLAAHGLRNPLTNAPFTESLLLGIGGGLGVLYILWKFKAHHAKVLVLGFHNQPQYPVRFYQGLCDRLGVTVAMPETGSIKTAGDQLRKLLEKDHPALAWVDRAHMPYLQLPEAMDGHIGHIVAVSGKDGDDLLVDDRAVAPFRMTWDEFAAARARIGSYKNRLLVVEKIGTPDVVHAVRTGLQACVDHLSSPSDSFSLPTIRKWGKMMTDSKNKKGWPTVFKDRRGLYSTLRSIYEGIELNVGNGSLRSLYAQFLREAAEITGILRLNDVAEQYAAISRLWTGLAETVLPPSVAALNETRILLDQRHAITMQGGDAWTTSHHLTDKLRVLSRENNLAFPMGDAEVNDLFSDMQARLMAIYDAEVEAHNTLRTAIQ